MDNIYYINKIEKTINEEINKYQKFSLKDFILLNRDLIIMTSKNLGMNKGIELLSELILKLPANCDLQKNLIKIVKEYLENEQNNQ